MQIGLTGLINKRIFRWKQKSSDKLKEHIIRWQSWDQCQSSWLWALFIEEMKKMTHDSQESSTKCALMETSVIREQNENLDIKIFLNAKARYNFTERYHLWDSLI